MRYIERSNMMKRIAKGLIVVMCILLLIIFTKALLFSSKQVSVKGPENLVVDKFLVARHLAGALACRTISSEDESRLDRGAFLELHRYLERTYPRAHRVMKKEVINGLSLLYTWQGTDPSLKPLLLMSHLDVVPAEKSDGEGWTHPPFSGTVAGGYIWGRGALDVKNGLIGIMEAMEMMAVKGISPARTFYLAFGHDEEVGGDRGNGKIAELLKERGIRLACVIDEGGYIVDGMIPGVSAPVALIGIAEKGYLSVELSAQGAGGHSSMPPENTNVGKVARAVYRLEKNPFPGTLDGPARDMFEFVGPEMPFAYRILFANTWLFKPLIGMVLSGAPSTAAMIRTTTAATMFHAGTMENVLAQKAVATINFRILPGETAGSVIDRVRRVIDDDNVIITELKHSQEPSPVSAVNAGEFTALQRAISAVFPRAIAAPYLVVGATDSRHYSGIADQVYRFLPARLGKDDMKRIHGVNERISVDNMAEIPLFILTFIKELDRR